MEVSRTILNKDVQLLRGCWVPLLFQSSNQEWPYALIYSCAGLWLQLQCIFTNWFTAPLLPQSLDLHGNYSEGEVHVISPTLLFQSKGWRPATMQWMSLGALHNTLLGWPSCVLDQYLSVFWLNTRQTLSLFTGGFRTCQLPSPGLAHLFKKVYLLSHAASGYWWDLDGRWGPIMQELP